MFFDIYSCNGDEEALNNIKKFPELKFHETKTNTYFIFNYNDLFQKIEERYYFMVIFQRPSNLYWRIGFPFFKKYDIVFNDDSKMISYYNENIIDDNENKNNNTGKIILIVFLSLIVFFGLIGIGYFLGKEKYMQRKKRANELNEDYNYDSQEKIINDNGEIVEN